MPAAPLKPCSYPGGCAALVTHGRCPAHARQSERDRGNSTERGYGSRWQHWRAAYLKQVVALNPFCADCHKIFRHDSDIELHHVRKLADHPELQYVASNVRALCADCHQKRTRRGE